MWQNTYIFYHQRAIEKLSSYQMTQGNIITLFQVKEKYIFTKHKRNILI